MADFFIFAFVISIPTTTVNPGVLFFHSIVDSGKSSPNTT